MAQRKLTEEGVKRLKPPADGEPRVEIWDTALKGLGLRVSASGVKSFVFMYRFGGKQCRMTIGRYDQETFKVADAKSAVNAALMKLEDGKDPAVADAVIGDKKDERVSMLLKRYVVWLDGVKKRRSWREVERALTIDLVPRFGARTARSLRMHEIATMTDEIVLRGAPVHANRVLVMTKGFLSWCLRGGLVEQNVASPLKPPTEEEARERVLDMAELVRIWQGVEGMGWPFCPIVRLITLTACRRNEVSGMRRSELDLASATWTIPKARMKAKKDHVVPLSPAAVDIICSLPDMGSDLVFSNTGTTEVSGWSKWKLNLDEAIAGQGGDAGRLDPWVIHDLRRSAASGMAALGVGPHVIEAALAHRSGTIKGVARIYNRHGYEDEKRQALNLWAETVKTAVAAAVRESQARPACSQGELEGA
jgi:integrase